MFVGHDHKLSAEWRMYKFIKTCPFICTSSFILTYIFQVHEDITYVRFIKITSGSFKLLMSHRATETDPSCEMAGTS